MQHQTQGKRPKEKPQPPDQADNQPQIVHWGDIDAYDPSRYDALVLALGDSWFAQSDIPSSDLLRSLRFNQQMMILDCSSPGDSLKRMAEISRDRVVRSALSTEDYPWNLILLSGGGDDLFDQVDALLKEKRKRRTRKMQQPADYCDQARLDRLIKEIQEGYRRLIAVRDASNSPAKGRPVMTHTYDYPTPRNAPARFLTTPLVGPWLYQAFTRAEVPEGAWLELAEYFIDRLAEGLLALSNSDNPLPNFHVVDSRGLLHRARLGTEGESGDWLNEIHPRRSGYEKLAKAWEKKITALLKPRPRSVKR